MDTPDIDDQITEFSSQIDDLHGPFEVIDPATFGEDELLPKGTYMALVMCDNCATEVFVIIHKGIKVPRDFPAETCLTCGVTGSIYRPITEKEYMDEVKRRWDNR